MTPQELKASILQLAIQGKLVEQRPEEGTGEELYKQIQAEKQELIKSGKIKKEKPLSEITEDEIPFDIPESWKWVRVGDYVQKVTDYVASGSFASLRENVKIYKEPNYAILVKTKDFQSNFTNDLTYTDKHGYEFLENSRLFGGELIMPNIGASIGKVFKVPYLDAKMTLAPNSVLIRFVSEEHLDWFSYYFASPIGFAQLKTISASTAQAKFSKTEFKGLLIPVPPLAEQKRIVAKIEELLPYIERYEQAWNKLEEFNKKFPVDMQKSVLQMAIQGELVEQRPEEGTGEDLFKQIQAEKQELIESGKIKKQKALPEITEDEIPFDIPESWKWVRFDNLCAVLTCGYASTPTYVSKENGMPFISAKNVKPYKFMPEDHNYISHELYDKLTQNAKPEKGDILLTRVGAGIGEAAIIDTDLDFAIYVSLTLIKLVSNNLIDNQYILYWLNSPIGVSSAKKNIYGKNASQGNLNVKNVREFLVPLPPLAEQKRIVQKLGEILPLCGRLK